MLENNTSKSLDRILQSRYHGAVNIRGIRLQILYSIYISFEEYKKDSSFQIQLEGIEDLDLIGLKSREQYIQVKTSDNKWSWSKYNDVFKAFYETYKINKNATFVLACNFNHNLDWLKITNQTVLNKKEKKRLESKLKKASLSIGIADEDFYKAITLKTFAEDGILGCCNEMIQEKYSSASNSISDIYLNVLFSKFISLAENRGTVSKSLLDTCWLEINVNIERQKEYTAYGDGLVSKVKWQKDQRIDDFFDGKRVRAGHIASEVDVKRVKWLTQIDIGLSGSRICIIRASSGQGKSTLLYRYAFDYWDEKYVYILKSAKTSKEVELVKDFLRHIKSFELPILLLLDNVDTQTSRWTEIIGFCSEIGIMVLVTIRHEDWFRYSDSNVTNYEIVQPDLDLQEAKELFDAFRNQNKIHSDVNSYQWAYDRIGEPRLLIEYVYLLTHGEMLKERLEKQIKQISELDEDKVKIDILRLISSADSLGSPINLNKLKTTLSFNKDPQYVIESLLDEYIEQKGELLQGLHWVRSKHLADLLHKQVYELTDTAIKLLKLIPASNLAGFIENCLINDRLNKSNFLKRLSLNLSKYSLYEIQQVFCGLFLGGENQFYLKNKSHFAKAYELLGISGANLLAMSLTPTEMINAIDRLKDIETNDVIDKLHEIVTGITDKTRGKELCVDFTHLIKFNEIEFKFKKDEMLNAPDIFYWLKISGIQLNCSFFLAEFDDLRKIEQKDERVFIKLLSGLYEYSSDEYWKWYRKNKTSFHNLLRYRTDSVEMKIKDKELIIRFIPFNEELSPNEQAMSRLNQLREALPFCLKYCCDSINLLPFGLEPTVKDSTKRIPTENIPLGFYTMQNKKWLDIVEKSYLPDNFYSFEKSHFKLRENCIKYLSILNSFFKKTLTGKKYDIQGALNRNNLVTEIGIQIDTVPPPPKQCDEDTTKKYNDLTRNSLSHFRNFLYQFVEYFNKQRQDDIGKMALHNLNIYRSYLPELYTGFNSITLIAPDYFGFDELKDREIKYAENLIDLFEIYIKKWKAIPIYNFEEQINRDREKAQLDIIEDVRKSLKELNVIVANRLLLKFPLTYLPLYYPVKSMINPEIGLEDLLPFLKDVKNKPSFYYLIPLFKDNLIMDGGYRIGASVDKNNINWESLVPAEIPTEAMELLPEKVKKDNLGLCFKNDLIGSVVLLQLIINQMDLLCKDEDDYYIIKLNDKISKLHLDSFIKLKEHFSEFYVKYSEHLKELKLHFDGLDLEHIILLINDFIKINDYEKAIAWLSENIPLFEAILKYFNPGSSE